MKFIHCADVHLDSPLRGLEQYEGAPVAEIRSAPRRAFEEIIRYAIEEPVDFVLIAGDLYDRDLEDFNTAIFFGRQMAKLDEVGIPVFMITGNHDADSKITKKLRMLPKNVKIFSSSRPEFHILDALDVVVHGQSFAKGAVPQDLASTYPQRHPGKFNIGLLHTSLAGMTDHDPYAPTTLDVLRSKGYDYWALGHIHHREIVATDPYVVFPGNPQGRHAREDGEKTCELVEVISGSVSKVQAIPTSQVIWHHLSVDVTGAANAVAVYELVEQQLRHLVNDDRLHCVRVEITGSCGGHGELLQNRTLTENELRQCAVNVSDRIWVERIQLHTSEPIAHILDHGPVDQIQTVASEIKDEGKLQEVISLLKQLDDKLPSEIREGPDSLSLTDPKFLHELIDEAATDLIVSLSRSTDR